MVQAIRDAGEPQAGSLCHLGLSFVMSEQHPVLAEVAGVGLAWRTGEGAYVPLASGASDPAVWEKLGPVWSDPDIAKVGADLKAALLLAHRFGPDLKGITGDILLASYLLNPGRYEQTLENVALHYLGLNLPGPRELAGRPTPAVGLDPDLACQYAAQRAEAALRLWPELQRELHQEGLWELYAGLELPLLGILARMEARGILLDQEFLRRFGQDLEDVDAAAGEERFMPWRARNFSSSRPSNWAASSLRKCNSRPRRRPGAKPPYPPTWRSSRPWARRVPSPPRSWSTAAWANSNQLTWMPS